jgi:hypothetical protein
MPAAKPEPRPAPRRPRAPRPLGVITAALGLFFVVLTLLAIQVRSGRDPALGPAIVSPPAISQPAGGKGGASTQAQQATSIVTRTSPVPPP